MKMSPEQVFSLSNAIALAGWLVLIFAGRHRRIPALVCGAILPLLIAFLYSALLIGQAGQMHGGFGSLGAVSTLFSNPWLLLAGWVHYLAFDLFIGSWEMRDALAHGIPYLAVIPCLLLTFLFGPAGLLLYFAIRAARVRKIEI